MDAADEVSEPSAMETPSTTDTSSTIATQASTAVTWADQATSKAGDGVKAGATKLVGWTTSGLETATHGRGLRPMHVRVSVRIHHVNFLHPGLDNGGGATIGGGRNGKWRSLGKRGRMKSVTPPGLLQFGNKKGSWKNPMSPKSPRGTARKDDLGRGKSPTELQTASLENKDAAEAAEISEIISAEAFRLSRDGVIQHHYALKQASEDRERERARAEMMDGGQQPVASPRSNFSSMRGSARPHGRPPPPPPPTPTPPSNTMHSSMLSPHSVENPEDAARYYRECAARPKGYRRLVVSSAAPSTDAFPPPPAPEKRTTSAAGTFGAAASIRTTASGRNIDGSNRTVSRAVRGAGSSAAAQHLHKLSSDHSIKEERDGRGNGTGRAGAARKNENSFDNVEYQYIGPPQTGPEFFTLLRAHGAATFGRYLPEVACSVPNHSIRLELRKSKSKRSIASTQPLVPEAPHIIWGDARDKMLSRIADEGCPLIDSRKFEYVSNAALDETELSESLMVCGATLWVQNADEVSGASSASPLKPHYTKGMVKAEYYGGKVADKIKEGVGLGTKGLVKGTAVTIHVAEKGSKEVVKGTKVAAHAVEKGTKKVVEKTHKLLPTIHQDTELETVATSHALTKENKHPRRSKLKNVFNPKKMKNKLRRRSKGTSSDEISVEGSVASEFDDAASVGSEVAVADSAHADLAEKIDAGEDLDIDLGPGDVTKATENELKVEDEFALITPVPYVLLLDDIIDIHVVSFPDKDDVIANFPISVASVMVQRSIEDRTADPLKPSELTATLIQEPSAQLLRWGVELKVTLRAVEVKPQVPKVVGTKPKDFIDEELKTVKEKLVRLGKSPEEVKRDMQVQEDEIVKQENKLNEAIVAYGLGKGENEGGGQSDVRLRQMFYDEREHSAITRKMKRRTQLTNSEKVMLNDATVDPSRFKIGTDSKDEQTLLEMLDLNFPRIDEEDDTHSENVSTAATSTKNEAITANDSLAKASMSLAKSLDNCLAGLTEKPTVPIIEQRLRHTFDGRTRPLVCKTAAKEWCSQVAKKLSTHVSNVSATDATVKTSIAKLQGIIAESAMGSGIYSEESLYSSGEEMKISEEEISMLETKAADSHSEKLNSSKLVEWATAVIVELESCAAELDDDVGSLAYSEALNSFAQPEEEKSILSSLDSLGRGSEDPPRSNSRVLDSHGSSLSMPSDSAKRSSDPEDEELWDKILSPKENLSASLLSNSTQRFRSATSISTVNDTLTRSDKPNPQTKHLLKMMKESRGQSHMVNDVTSSLTTSLFYLSVIAAAFTLGAYVIYYLNHQTWALGTN